ncbi:glycosyltransferase family 2 protein [Oscillospiraceae bacterium CM]|nr:glycosyltransferase family 2 protein [Oscillospiraceae bacterium CM]
MISIIVPVYNGEKYLDRCLNAILRQTYRDIEILLVDDGSKDASFDICRRYEKADHRVRVIHRDNGGVSAARNAGLDNAVGQYIQFVDADDYLEPDCCRTLVEAIEESGCDMAVSAFNNVYEQPGGELKTIPIKLPIAGRFETAAYVRQFDVLQGFSPFIGGVWNKMYRREALQASGVRFREDISLHEDSIFNFRFYRHTASICVVNQCLYNYFHELGNMSLSRKKQRELHRLTHLFYSEYKMLFKAYDAYSGCRLLHTEENCYRAYLVCLLSSADRRNPLSHAVLNELKAYYSDAVFMASLPYAQLKNHTDKWLNFLIARRRTVLLALSLYLTNAWHRFGARLPDHRLAEKRMNEH